MTKEQSLALLRQGLITVGTVLTTFGVLDADLYMALSGAALVFVGVVWSFMKHTASNVTTKHPKLSQK